MFREIPYHYKQHNHIFTYLSQQFVYSFIKNGIVLLDLPIVVQDRGYHIRKGLAVVRVQGEYAYIMDERIEATLVANCIVPMSHAKGKSSPLIHGCVSGFFWNHRAVRESLVSLRLLRV